jgi:hypothetical protein
MQILGRRRQHHPRHDAKSEFAMSGTMTVAKKPTKTPKLDNCDRFLNLAMRLVMNPAQMGSITTSAVNSYGQTMIRGKVAEPSTVSVKPTVVSLSIVPPWLTGSINSFNSLIFTFSN